MLTKKKERFDFLDFISVILDRYEQEEIECKILNMRLSSNAAILSRVIK